MEPCHLCPRSFYTSDEMSTSCMSCPFGKTTAYSGAADTINCSCTHFIIINEHCFCHNILIMLDILIHRSSKNLFHTILLFTDFDIQFTKAQQQIYFDPPTTNQKQLSVSTWIALPKTMGNFSLLRIDSSSVKIEFQYLDSLVIEINRYIYLNKEFFSYFKIFQFFLSVIVYIEFHF